MARFTRRPDIPAHLQLDAGSGAQDREQPSARCGQPGVDRSDNLLVLSSAGFDASVYSLKPDGPDGTLTRIEAACRHASDAAIALPVDWWVNGEFKDQYDPASDQFPTMAELFTAMSQRRLPANMPHLTAAWCYRPIVSSIRGRPTTAVGGSHIRWIPTASRQLTRYAPLCQQRIRGANLYGYSWPERRAAEPEGVRGARGRKCGGRRIRPRLRRQRPGLSLWAQRGSIGSH